MKEGEIKLYLDRKWVVTRILNINSPSDFVRLERINQDDMHETVDVPYHSTLIKNHDTGHA